MKKLHILVSNDDGIYSPGIASLAKVALRFGEAPIVAPDVEQSFMSHATLPRVPYVIAAHHSRRNRSLPGQRDASGLCLGVFQWDRVDLVLSGINLGPNLGSATWHSGTIAAAKQAALLGLRGIAFSTAVTISEKASDFTALEPFVEKVLALLLKEKEMCLVNVNCRKNRRASAGPVTSRHFNAGSKWIKSSAEGRNRFAQYNMGMPTPPTDAGRLATAIGECHAAQ